MTAPELFTLSAPVCQRDALKPPSVADLVAFEALPTETRELALRVLGSFPVTDQLLAAAYEKGWEDCADDIEPPTMSYRQADRAIETLKRRKGGVQ